jgi:hypothetical protein
VLYLYVFVVLFVFLLGIVWFLYVFVWCP